MSIRATSEITAYHRIPEMQQSYLSQLKEALMQDNLEEFSRLIDLQTFHESSDFLSDLNAILNQTIALEKSDFLFAILNNHHIQSFPSYNRVLNRTVLAAWHQKNSAIFSKIVSLHIQFDKEAIELMVEIAANKHFVTDEDKFVLQLFLFVTNAVKDNPQLSSVFLFTLFNHIKEYKLVCKSNPLTILVSQLLEKQSEFTFDPKTNAIFLEKLAKSTSVRYANQQSLLQIERWFYHIECSSMTFYEQDLIATSDYLSQQGEKSLSKLVKSFKVAPTSGSWKTNVNFNYDSGLCSDCIIS